MPAELLIQAAKATAYYAGLVVLMRLAGKRLAGQTTTFDLIVLITLGVVLQTTALQEGVLNALVFARDSIHLASADCAARALQQPSAI